MEKSKSFLGDLKGKIYVSKRLRQHPVWGRDSFSYGQAWVDLLLLANDLDRTATLKGETVKVKRGQLLWSIRGLEKEWQRSGEWIERFLKFCRDNDMIKVESNHRRTVITILQYDAYQGAHPNIEPETKAGSEPGTDSVTGADSKPDSEPGRNGNLGKGMELEGEAPPAAKELSPMDEVREFCESYEDTKRGVKGIPESWWMGWQANLLESGRSLPINWREVVKLRFTADLAAGHPKALGYQAGGEIKKMRRPRRTGNHRPSAGSC